MSLLDFFKDFIIKIIMNNLEEIDSKENIELRIIFNIDNCTSLLSHLFTTKYQFLFTEIPFSVLFL